MQKVLHLISGGDEGGAKTHVLGLLKELQKHISPMMICFMDGSFYRDAVDMGISIQLIEQKKRYDLSVLHKIAHIINKNKIQILHCHGARANFIGQLLKFKVSLPTVTTVHSDYQLDFQGNFYKQFLYAGLNKFALKRFDYYIAVSDEFKQMLIQRNFPSNKIFTVYNGIDFSETHEMIEPSSFLSQYHLDHLRDKTLFGIAARLHPVKGHKTLFHAMEKVVSVIPDAHLLLAGDGELKDSLEKLAKKLGLEKNIHFLGFSSDPYSFIHSLTVNLLTSFSESFPYVLLEGAKLKKPTIASKVGGIPKLIQNEVTGLLFTPGNAEELAHHMIHLAQNPSLQKHYGEKLYEYAAAHYSLKRLGEQHISIYNTMLAEYERRNK